MKFALNKSLEILDNTPDSVAALLHQVSEDWVNSNEGEDTWSVKEVVAHLIVCEETDWLPRIRIILKSPNTVFIPIDMQAHFSIAQKYSLKELLIMFRNLRDSGLAEIRQFEFSQADFQKVGIHPVLGKVTLQELISTWVTHDMTHLGQIARIIAKQNVELVGSFKQYLRILN